MDLRDLLAGVPIRDASPDLPRDVTGAGYDSHTIQPGQAFVAIHGAAADGHDYTALARQRGAACAISTHPVEGLPYVIVPDTRQALARMSGNFFRHPDRELHLIGVTGTNGKTSVAWLTAGMLQTLGIRAGLMGTNGCRIGDTVLPSRRTTPESWEVQRLLRQMADSGCTHAVMEVSSHALALDRVCGLAYTIAAFTNLSRDHLDFHGTMDRYAQAKSALFRQCGQAAVNRDDPWASRILRGCVCPVYGYGIRSGDLRAEDLVLSPAGGVLGMVSYPTYDLNNAFTVQNDLFKKNLTDTSDQLLKQWRNKTLNDTYEPGSTFKILTMSAAMEEGLINMNTTYTCTGGIHVSDATIHCTGTHGTQTLKEAAAHSCNPAFITFGLQLGNEKFYEYMNDFGLMQGSGVDLDGEASGVFASPESFTQLDLACYAFGQNFNVTPMALIAAQAACVNGGYLHAPYLVEQIVDSDGNVTYQHDNTPVRQVISEETSAHVRECLEYVVSDGTGRNGQVKGYRVGGKTGTADKGQTGDLVVSFVSFAPADDPQVIILVTMDTPSRSAGTSVSGGSMVAPVNSKIMADILPYLGIEPTYSAEELLGADTTVPYVIGSTVEDARSRMEARGFTCKVVGSGGTVTDQTPAGGAVIPGKATIILYAGAEKPNTMYTVPQLVGKTAAEANVAATNAGLLVRFSGATQTTSGNIRVLSQSLEAGQQVPAGTVITVQLGDTNMTD